MIICFLALESCSGFKEVGEVLRNEKTNSTDEFLVKKRDPLILPPDYSEIPEPGSISKNTPKEEKIKEILKGPSKVDAKQKKQLR